MKKCATIIFYSALFLLFSCTGSKSGKNEQPQAPKGSEIKIDTINIHDKYTFAYVKEDAPILTIDISLPTIDLGNNETTAKLDSTLALGIFSLPYTLRESCDSFISNQKKDFDWLRNDYHNLKEEGMPPGLMQQYCDIVGKTIRGYKGYINYIVNREEYYGGAHPYTYHIILNIDPTTGTEITFYDIFKEGCEETLTAMLLDKLMKHANASTMDELHEKGYLYLDTGLFISQNFLLGNDSVTFLYNRYEIAPYALGDIKLTLDYRTLKDIMK
jgi:hypothetical protein